MNIMDDGEWRTIEKGGGQYLIPLPDGDAYKG